MRERLLVLAALALLPTTHAAAQAPPALDVNPTRVTFITAERRQSAVPQRVHIANAGGGELVWHARTNRPWITVTPASGVAPADLVISIDAADLPAGNYNGRITIDAGRATGSPAYVDVLVTLAQPKSAGPPGLKASSDKIMLRAMLGQAQKAGGTIKLEADREAAIKWVAKADQSWLAVAPAEGTTPSELNVEASPEGLPQGLHAGSIVVLSPDGKPLLRVPVTLQVGTAAGPLAFGGTSMPPATLNLPYSQAVPIKGGRPPYRVELAAGPLPPELTIVNGAITGVPRLPGRFTIGLVVTDSSDPPVTVSQAIAIPVIVLDYNTALMVQPASVTLVAAPPRLSPETVLTIASGSQPLPWRVTSDAVWLRVEPADGAAPAEVKLVADAKTLASGVYVATLTVTMDGAPNSPARVPVQLTVKK